MKPETDLMVHLLPSHFGMIIKAAMRLTKEGTLVWRAEVRNPKNLMAFPSSEIKDAEDFWNKIGETFCGISVGHFVGAPEEDEYLWFAVAFEDGNWHVAAFDDAPTEIVPLIKELHMLAKARCGKGSVTSLDLSGE